MTNENYWLGADPVTIIITTLLFLPLSIVGIVMLSSIPTFFMNRKKVLIAFQLSSVTVFIVYFMACISFLCGVINAQLEAKETAVKYNSFAVFCFGFGKIVMYCYFIIRLKMTRFDEYKIYPISTFILIILLILLSIAFVAIIPLVYDMVTIISYELHVVIVYSVQFIMDIFMLHQFGIRLFKAISIENYRQYRESNYFAETSNNAKLLSKIHRWCILAVLTSLSSLFASAMGFLRILINVNSRTLLYISIALLCYDCSINTICIYFSFDFTKYYHKFCCQNFEKMFNNLCHWWIVKNVEKLQKECRAFDGNLPQNIDVGCCDVCYGNITKHVCYSLCCNEKKKLIHHYSKSRTLSVFENAQSPASTNIMVSSGNHNHNNNDVTFQSTVDYELFHDKS